MKLFYAILVTLALAFSASAQTEVQGVSQGVSLKSNASDVLTLADSPVTAVIINGTQTIGTLGFLSFTSPVLASGDFQTGGTFGSGGVFMINAPSYVDYVGNFSSATWQENTLANGNHFYTLSGSLTSTEGNGSFVCTTGTFLHGGQWVSSKVIDNCSFVVNLN